MLPINFVIEGKWVEVSPDVKRTDDAIILDANEEKDVIPMQAISPISSNGIYTKEELEQFQRTLLFPSERKAITNTIARRVGNHGTSDSYYMPNVFSPTEFKNIARSAATEVWGFLSWMGNLFSVCGFLYTAFCLVSYGASVAHNFFTLRKLTENHPRRRRILWTSLWQSMANAHMIKLTHNKRKEEEKTIAEENAIDLQEVIASEPESPGIYPVIVPQVLPSAPCEELACEKKTKRVRDLRK